MKTRRHLHALVYIVASHLALLGPTTGHYASVEQQCRTAMGRIGVCRSVTQCPERSNSIMTVFTLFREFCHWSYGLPYFCCPLPDVQDEYDRVRRPQSTSTGSSELILNGPTTAKYPAITGSTTEQAERSRTTTASSATSNVTSESVPRQVEPPELTSSTDRISTSTPAMASESDVNITIQSLPKLTENADTSSSIMNGYNETEPNVIREYSTGTANDATTLPGNSFKGQKAWQIELEKAYSTSRRKNKSISDYISSTTLYEWSYNSIETESSTAAVTNSAHNEQQEDEVHSTFQDLERTVTGANTVDMLYMTTETPPAPLIYYTSREPMSTIQSTEETTDPTTSTTSNGQADFSSTTEHYKTTVIGNFNDDATAPQTDEIHTVTTLNIQTPAGHRGETGPTVESSPTASLEPSSPLNNIATAFTLPTTAANTVRSTTTPSYSWSVYSTQNNHPPEDVAGVDFDADAIWDDTEVEKMPSVEPMPMSDEDKKRFQPKPVKDTWQNEGCGKVAKKASPSTELEALLREIYPISEGNYNSLPLLFGGQQARVAGGTAAVQGQWPWMSVIGQRVNGEVSWFCGGTIVDRYHVLTAAHCVKGRPNVVRFGDAHISDTGADRQGWEPGVEERAIDMITIHPAYRPTSFYHDMAVITLSQPLQFTDFIRPVCLPDLGYKIRRTLDATITGYGHMEFNGKSNPSLQQADVKMIHRKECNASYAKLGSTFFNRYPKGILSHVLCAGHKSGGIDACQGDSGGPLIQHIRKTDTYMQIGVIATGFGCGNPNFPGLYTSIKHHRKFIANVVRRHPSSTLSRKRKLLQPRIPYKL